eukprot:gene2840-17741_t
MFAKFTSSIFGGSTFPYTVEDAYESSWGGWIHSRGKTDADESPVSIFKISSANVNDRALVAARNGIKRLKLMRHPNVLAFKDSHEITDKGMTNIYLVTQPVRPLKEVLEELALEGQQRADYLAMGILHMTKAVSFLNNDCNQIHGHLSLDAVVVTETLDWKLHGFDLLTELAAANAADAPIKAAAWMVENQYKSAELGKSEWDVIEQSPPWAVDAWGLGCLIQEAFSQEYMKSMENLRRTDGIPQALLQDYQKLLSSNPSRRLNPNKMAECKFLNNRLVDVVNFMENISVKDSMEKDTFFKRLPAMLPSIPTAVAIRKILPLLSSALEYGGAPSHAVGSLLIIGNQLDTEEFTTRVVPSLSKLFQSPDRGLRRSLLEGLDTFGQHLTNKTVEEQIFPHLQSGFSDGNAYIRELTLKSVLTLAPKLSNKTMVQNILKHLSKLQVDEEPSIRANTTVLLGNIAKYLGDATCKRVLLNAFTRALKDPFPPAKIAGLKAMVATKQYHTAEDAAMRILPGVAPLTIDPVGEVRAAALQCLETFTKTLKEADKLRAAEAVPVAAAPSANVSGELTAAQSVAGAPTVAGGLMTWAVSNLIGASSSAATLAAGGSTTSGGPGNPPSMAPPRQQQKPEPVASKVNSGWDVEESTTGAADGWNEDMGDDDFQEDEQEIQARNRLQAAASKPKPKPKPKPAPASDGWGDDDADDLGSAGGGGSGGGGWEGLEDLVPAEAVVKSDKAATEAAAAARRQAAAARVASRNADAAAKPKAASKPMRLGVSKLGAKKAQD